MMLRNINLAGALALAMAASSAFAQESATAPAAAAKVSAGATVSDTSGNLVGTIESVQGNIAVLSTGTTKVSLPLNSFGAGDKGPIIAMTKEQVEAAAKSATAANKAETTAQIAQGATVTDTSGGTVGTIEKVEGDFATVATTNAKVKLPLSAFGKGTTGPVIAMSAAQLEAAAKSAGGGAPAQN